ncbi:hypothetical protein Dda_4017 [Drechslerella dactyloides]|uniref:Uncharacterized protein n=1 Tax=Drechslerella dactyloides TaxID=74499 RepID=A0AAD6IZU7_DREDA|nr:hypothetical protein Dda_4017 [Drechslerella dactyloides]
MIHIQRNRYRYLLWNSNDTATTEFVEKTDDAWAKVSLEFPITMFGKTSQVAWISVNGIFSIDEPDLNVRSVPERTLPVDPSSCNTTNFDSSTQGGCIPNTAILPLWRDMSMKAGIPIKDLNVEIAYTWHKGYETPHHHIAWMFCDKEVSWDTNTSVYPSMDQRCGKAFRFTLLTFGPDKPGVYLIQHQVFNYSFADVQGVIGAQSYSEGKSMMVPVGDIYKAGVEGLAGVNFDTDTLEVTPYYG